MSFGLHGRGPMLPEKVKNDNGFFGIESLPKAEEP